MKDWPVLMRAQSDVLRPLGSNVLIFSDLHDHRVLFFWLIQATSTILLLFWLLVATHLAGIPIPLNLQQVRHILAHSAFIAPPSGIATNHHNTLGAASSDIWFVLSLTVAVDATAVVATCNRALIRRFHYVVSQRMIFLASAISYAVWSWSRGKTDFLSRHPAESCVLGFTVHVLLGFVLDRLELCIPVSGVLCRSETLADYSRHLGRSETSWRRALFHSIIVGGMGVFLTIFIPSRWSAWAPAVHILFESVFLSVMKANRTPRYLVLCSPPFYATIGVHWGIRPIINNLHLTISHWTFLALVVLGRLLLDAHLWTILRLRPELQWARANVLLSTRRLLGICVGFVFLEMIGVKVITYIKPISVLVLFGLSFSGSLAIAAYNVALKPPSSRGLSINKYTVPIGIL
ncbi:hypothetical protein BDV26DRAFT_295715 [Aspergillus bertholletiae]|uniref:Uncharacterized protein n=1 Tax=Aspergillus bertholletiae TaxID=1226010 RepID=A0A5N7AXY6_9EURO|nr:hypothetical protein BDV26DRAFT_295715 [Aspergillus bertholletiae]